MPTTIYTHLPLHDPATTQTYTLSLHDALPILFDGHGHDRRIQPGSGQSGEDPLVGLGVQGRVRDLLQRFEQGRSEEHTSELQSRGHLVCRLLLEKKKMEQMANA